MKMIINIKSQGSICKGIASCLKDKYGRIGIRLIDILNNNSLKHYLENLKHFDPKKHVINEELYGNILCEGVHGFWLDIDFGNYPYI